MQEEDEKVSEACLRHTVTIYRWRQGGELGGHPKAVGGLSYPPDAQVVSLHPSVTAPPTLARRHLYTGTFIGAHTPVKVFDPCQRSER